MVSPFEDAAQRLRNAYSGETIEPLRTVLASDDVEGAYSIQAINTRIWLGEGRRIVGRKVGLTNPAVQKQLGVDQPDFGVLFEDMQLDPDSTLDPGKLIQPKVEAEIALILGADLLDPQSVEDVAAATSGAMAALEIVDSRIADWRITFADTVADNGSSAFFVLSGDQRPLSDLDLTGCRMRMTINGEVASEGSGVACLGNPLNAALWLARTLADQGEPLRQGDIVMTGALGPMVVLTPGAVVRAEIDGLGSVGFQVGQPNEG